MSADKCQYAEDVGMPEHRCFGSCQYELHHLKQIEDAVKAERNRCLKIVDEWHGGGRSFVMRKISEPAV